MLRIFFQNDVQFIQAFERKGPAIIGALVRRLNEMMVRLQSYVVSNKLSGQALARRTGKLAASIRYIPAVLNGTQIEGSVEGGGGPAWYGKLFETTEVGGTGGGSRFYTIMAVRARALAFVGRSGDKVFVRPPAFVNHPPAQMRPFMSTALEEQSAAIRAGLQEAVSEELNKP